MEVCEFTLGDKEARERELSQLDQLTGRYKQLGVTVSKISPGFVIVYLSGKHYIMKQIESGAHENFACRGR